MLKVLVTLGLEHVNQPPLYIHRVKENVFQSGELRIFFLISFVFFCGPFIEGRNLGCKDRAALSHRFISQSFG